MHCDGDLDRALSAALEDYALITMAADGSVRRWSEGAETIFGYTASEMTGRPVALLFTSLI